MCYTIPFRTLLAIMEIAYSILKEIQDHEITIDEESTGNKINTVTILNGTTSIPLPSQDDWSLAYKSDKECTTIIQMIKNQSLITKENLEKVHYTYRQPIRNSEIKWENERLYLLEGSRNSGRVVRTIIVPNQLYKHVFSAFHTNPMGGHFSAYQTFHRIRLRFHWPKMYRMIQKWIQTCAGCIMKDTQKYSKSELLYSFPLDAPMNSVHIDIWTPGAIKGFENETSLLIVVCHMTGFVALEPIKAANSQEFAKASYKIFLRYGLPKLIIVDADSKFKAEYKGMCSLLKLELFPLAKGNHDAMLVERFNKFLNGGL